jgi:molecular chaperone GrpE
MDNEKEITPTPQPGEAAASTPAVAGEGDPPAPPAPTAEQLLAEKQELYDRLLRKQAELDNFRKRAQKEKEGLRQHAAEELIRSLLPTLDGLERALNHRDEGVPESYYQGLELIYRELREVLGRAGLVPVETVGQLFDPHLHQAVETVQAPDRREHEIVEELQRGYKLGHRLLRPAIVKVAVGGWSDEVSPDGKLAKR